MTTLTQAQELKWRQVPEAAIKLAEKTKPKAEILQKAVENLPREGFLDLWYDSEGDRAIINLGDWVEMEVADAWKDAVRPHVSEIEIADEVGNLGESRGYVKVAFRTAAAIRFAEKKAADPNLKAVGQYLGYLPGKIPGAPNPLIATLASGLLGGGLGYGGGKALEWLLPETKRWNLTPRLALLGGMAGATPGAAWMANNYMNDKPIWDGSLMEGEGYVSDAPHYEHETSVAELLQKASAFKIGFNARSHPDYSFDSEEFNQAVWNDPRVSSRLDGATQAAATGLVTGAARSAGSPRLVGPRDIGMLTAGMGSGYVSGAIVGKALGALLGMPQQTQDRLKQTGMWAGVVANLVPLAFGAR